MLHDGFISGIIGIKDKQLCDVKDPQCSIGILIYSKGIVVYDIETKIAHTIDNNDLCEEIELSEWEIDYINNYVNNNPELSDGIKISDIMSYNLREEIDREILRDIRMIVGGGQMTKENQDVIRTERHVRNKSCTGKKLTMKWTVGE